MRAVAAISAIRAAARKSKNPTDDANVAGLSGRDVLRLVGGIVADQREAPVQSWLHPLDQSFAGDLQHVDPDAAEARFRGIDQQQVAVLDAGRHRLPHRGLQQQVVRFDAERRADPVVAQRHEFVR